MYYGGRGGGKSWAFAEALLLRALREPIRVLCTREVQASIADSVHKLLRDTIDRMQVGPWFRITQNTIVGVNGSEFIFKGLRDPDTLKSAEGVDVCWIEEAQKVPKWAMEKLVPTIRKSKSEVWMSLNPENESDYVYTRYILGKVQSCIRHHVLYSDNKFFTAELEFERQELLRRIAESDNDDERAQLQSDYDHIWLGHTKSISNEVIFSGKYHTAVFPDDLWKQADRLLFGADFGFAQDPSTLIRMFIHDKCLYIEYEAYGTGVELDEMDAFYRAVPGSTSWPIKADSSRPETISHIRSFGYNVSAAEKWQGSVEDGIAHLKGFKKIIIHERCKHTIDEAKKYKYKVDRITGEVLPIVVDKHNHCWDAIRYGLDGYIQRRGDLGIWAKLGK